MAWQRKTPFGYMIQNGEIICHPQESGAVREIFARYLQVIYLSFAAVNHINNLAAALNFTS